jgi:hypothetical protein
LDDDHVFRFCPCRDGFKHIQQVIEGGLAGYADERLGFTPGLEACIRVPKPTVGMTIFKVEATSPF